MGHGNLMIDKDKLTAAVDVFHGEFGFSSIAINQSGDIQPAFRVLPVSLKSSMDNRPYLYIEEWPIRFTKHLSQTGNFGLYHFENAAIIPLSSIFTGHVMMYYRSVPLNNGMFTFVQELISQDTNGWLPSWVGYIVADMAIKVT